MALLPDEPNDQERLEQLPEDHDTPFRPAEQGELDDTHPVTDTEVEPGEEYEEGVSGAAEASEPKADNAVVGYDPAKDQRSQPPEESEDQS